MGSLSNIILVCFLVFHFLSLQEFIRGHPRKEEEDKDKDIRKKIIVIEPQLISQSLIKTWHNAQTHSKKHTAAARG